MLAYSSFSQGKPSIRILTTDRWITPHRPALVRLSLVILNRLTVSARLPSDALDPPTLETLRYFVSNSHALAQWVPPVVLAVLLRIMTARWKHQLIFPVCESAAYLRLIRNSNADVLRFPNYTYCLLCDRYSG